VLSDGLDEGIGHTVEFNVGSHVSTDSFALSLEFLSDGIEGEGESLSEGGSQTSVDKVLHGGHFFFGFSPESIEDFVRHESSSGEGDDTNNGGGQSLVEGHSSLLSEDDSGTVNHSVILGLGGIGVSDSQSSFSSYRWGRLQRWRRFHQENQRPRR